MIPSFLTWLETDENPALSPPMHKTGRTDLARDVEEAMLSLTKKLMDGSRSEQDILAAVAEYVSKKSPKQEPDAPQAPVQQDQAAEINPVAQGSVAGNF